MKRPKNRTLLGLQRLIAAEDTAVQVIAYENGGTSDDGFGAMRPGVNYWPSTRSDTERIRFSNTAATIAYMWPESWTYELTDDGHAVIAIRQNRSGGARLVLRLHQPEVLAANWSASLTPDRIEDN